MVLVAPPPPSQRPRPLFRTMPAGSFIVRLFDPTSYSQTALAFRHFGPLRRFDHQTNASGNPAHDADRGIYYAALTLSGCIVEIFGDTGLIDCAQWHIARPQLTRPVKLLNLRSIGAMRAGSVAALAKIPDHALSQQWARYFYEQPEYRNCDGILYENAHNDEVAFALFERSANALVCPPTLIIRLDDPALRPELLTIARRNHMIVAP